MNNTITINVLVNIDQVVYSLPIQAEEVFPGLAIYPTPCFEQRGEQFVNVGSQFWTVGHIPSGRALPYLQGLKTERGARDAAKEISAWADWTKTKEELEYLNRVIRASASTWRAVAAYR